MPPYMNLFRTPDFNEEEERKRRLRPRPGETEIPSIALPTPLSRPNVPPMEAPERIEPFNPEPLTNYRGAQIGNEVDFGRDQYMRGGMDEQGKFKRSGKNIAVNALLGLGRGLQTGGGLGAGLGGALAGGLGATISPRLGREATFNALERPGIEQSMLQRKEQLAAQRQAAFDDLQRRQTEARIGLDAARAEQALRQPLPRPERRPGPISTSRGIFNPETGTIYPGTEPIPRPARQPTPRWIETSGGFIDLNDPRTDPTKVRKLQRPRAVAKPKAAPKYAAISDVREFAEKNGLTESQAVAKFKESGYSIAR